MYFITLATALFPLIGGPSMGKTSIINELKEQGEIICRETATDFIAEEQAKGDPTPWEQPGFEKRLFDENVQREHLAMVKAEQEGKSCIFLDRCLLDSIVYLDILGKQHTDEASYIYRRLAELNPAGRYTALFFVEPYNGADFQLIPSPVRMETTQQALRISEKTKEICSQIGLPIISVPPHLTPKERALFVMKKAQELTSTALES